MKQPNDQNSLRNLSKKTQVNDQPDSSTTSVTPQLLTSPEDMELNEEQLDIISGGGNGDLISKP